MKPRRLWLTVAGLIALIWAGVAVVMSMTDHLVSSPEKVIAMAADAPWLQGQKPGGAERQQYLDKVIIHLNQLDVSQRKRTREEGEDVLDKFLASLTEAEQKTYVDRTVQPHIDFIGNALKKMSDDERKRYTSRLRTDVKSVGIAPEEGSLMEREITASMTADDVVGYLSSLSVKEKMQLASKIEDMQSRVQGFR